MTILEYNKIIKIKLQFSEILGGTAYREHLHLLYCKMAQKTLRSDFRYPYVLLLYLT